MRTKTKTAVIALCLFFHSYAVSQETAAPVATPSKPDYGSYLQVIKEKVESTWKYPTGVTGTQEVTLRFVLDIDGKLLSADVVNSTDERLNSSAIEAMNRASPFPPIPDDLKRLVGNPLVMKFAVSSKPDLGSYLKVIKERVASTWKYPRGVTGTQEVTIRFVLDIDGKLVSAEVMDSTDARLIIIAPRWKR
jgi:TonB family protein